MIFEAHQTKYGTIRIPVPQTYKDVFILINSDIYRTIGKDSTKICILKRILQFNVLAWFRLCQLHDVFYPIKRRIYNHVSRKRNIDMPDTTRVGCGLYIGHAMCMVINETTIIGNNVNLSQFLNIGANKGNAAIICDGTYIAPMVCMVEQVTIGPNSVVGAGAVVVKDVLPNCKVGGGTFCENIR